MHLFAVDEFNRKILIIKLGQSNMLNGMFWKYNHTLLELDKLQNWKSVISALSFSKSDLFTFVRESSVSSVWFF